VINAKGQSGAQYELLIVSAASQTELDDASEHVLAALGAGAALASVGCRLRRTCRSGEYRRFVVASQPSDVLQLTSSSPCTVAGRRTVAFAFGDDPAWADAGQGLYRDEPIFRATIDECTRAVAETALHWHAGDAPGLFALQCAIAALLESWGIEPAAIEARGAGTAAGAAGRGRNRVRARPARRTSS
jgi:acyl transferase domain-containing protein